MFKKLWQKKTQPATQQETVEDVERKKFIQYALDVEETLRILEQCLHESDDLQGIITKTLETACDFYQGDWCGFIEVDMDLDLWTLTAWYNKNPEEQGNIVLNEFESSDALYRWIAAIKENTPLFIENTEDIKDEHPGEYEIYKRLCVNSLIAVPFLPRPYGVLVVRNPQRYANRSSMLQMLAYVVLTSVNEVKLLDSAKLAWSPEDIKSDRDIIINLFGELSIYTSKGVLHEADIKSPKVSCLLGYLLFNDKKMKAPAEIVKDIWPEESYESDNPGKNLKGLVYRFRQKYGLISDYQLIETTPYGYRINPELHIMTDLQLFDQYYDAAQQASNISARIEFLEKGIDIYKGNVLATASHDTWLMNTVSHYHLKYLGMVNELLKLLAERKDCKRVHQYATKSLEIAPGNMQAYYWLIRALCHQGAAEMARSEVKIAKQHLVEEDYHELIRKLRKTNKFPGKILKSVGGVLNIQSCDFDNTIE